MHRQFRRFLSYPLRIKPILAALVGLMVLALFLRVYNLATAPPGMHYDEIINGEIASLAKSGGLHFFYLLGWGREGLYHAFLALSRELPLPVHWQMRLPSILASLAGLALTYGWARRAFGTWVAVSTLAAMAVAFWTVALGRAALRATMLLPFAAASAWLLVAILENKKGQIVEKTATTVEIRRPDRTLVWKCLALALTLGLSVYTYRAARVLPVVFLVFLLYLTIWRHPFPRTLWLSLAGSLVVIAPLAIFLITNPGAEQRVGQVDLPWQELLDGDPRPVLQSALATAGMFGFQGDPQNHYNLAGRPIFEPVGALLFYAGLLIALLRWRQPFFAFIVIWLVIGLLPGVVTEPAPHFIHTVAAQPVVFVFFGLSVSFMATWTSERWGKSGEWAVAITLIIWTVANAFWTYQDYFIHWPQVAEVRNFHQSNLSRVTHFLDDSERETPVAICTSFLNESDPFWRSGRQSLPYFLNRTDLAVRWFDCSSAQVWPAGGQESRYFFLDDADFNGWVSESALESARPLDLDGAEARGVELALSGQLIQQLAELSFPPNVPAPVQFADSLQFLGFSIEENPPAPGSQVSLTTYWRIIETLPRDVAIFVHLVNQADEIVGQGDALSLLSDTLRPGDIFAQRHTVAIPPDATAGSHLLYIGVYSRVGEFPPLPMVDNDTGQETRLLITRLDLQPQRQ